jgi:hypothetical protein
MSWVSLPADAVTSVAGKTGVVTLAKADVGLGNVDNTSDLSKPISTATQTALDSKSNTSHTHSDATTTVAGLMSSTDKSKLDGIATSANNYVHPSTDGSLHVPATGTTNAGKVLTAGATAGSLSWTTLPADAVTSVAGKTGVVTLAKADVGLGSVDNTSDLSKPISTATQTALDSKSNTSHTHSDATTTVAGLMSSTDKSKLDGIATSANNYVHPSTDGSLHVPATGTTNAGKVLTAGATAGSMSWVSLPADAVTSVAGKTGVVTLVKADVGLGSVDNTSDLSKPISTATQTALDSKSNTSHTHSDATITSLDASKITSGTINSARLPSYVDDVLEYINLTGFPGTGESGKIYVALDTNKVYRWSGSAYIYITSGAVDSVAGKTGVVTLVKADVGLGNVDNTSDLSKPISTATQTALDSKSNTSHTHSNATTTVAGLMSSTDKSKLDGIASGATAYVHPSADGSLHVPATGTTNAGKVLTAGATAGSLTWTTLPADAVTSVAGKTGVVTLAKADVGLGNVDNTSDLSKPISTATQTALDSKSNTSHTHSDATTTVAGLMSSTDKSKLDGIAASANNYVHPSTDGSLHVPATGTTNAGKVLTAGATAGSLTWTALPADAVTSVAGKTGVVTLAKADVGLGNVDNTSDLSKPISTATQTALDGKAGTTGSGASGTWGINITGSAAQLNGLSSTQLFNNMGANHGNFGGFDSVSNFGPFFAHTSSGTSPGTGSSQFYGLALGLGNDYSYGSYALQLAIPRYHSSDKYITMRAREGGTWGSWTKISAGYADSAGSVSWAGVSGKPTTLAGYGITETVATSGVSFTNNVDLRAPIFYDSNNPSYYLDPASTGTSLQIAGTIEQGHNYAHPNIEWSAPNTSTGEVIFYLPGTISNYGMVHMVFDIYEYNSPRICTVIIGGHNWQTWYNTACNVIGYTDKSIRLGVKDGRFVVVFGNTSSTWSYGQIRLRKIQNGSYYNNIMDLGGDWSTVQTTTELFSFITGDLRGLRTPASLEVDGIIYGYSDVRTPILYDHNDTNYYVDPNGTTRINNLYVTGGVAGLSNSSSYTEAAIEIRERNFGGAQDDTWATAPRLSFHWSGRVASQIALSSNGWINIINNSGYGFESFRAGAIYATGDVTAYYSDERLKTKVGKIENALETIKSIETFKYTHNDIARENGFVGDEIQIGLSAQSVEKVVPEVVKHAPFDIQSVDGEITSKTGEWYKTVQYDRLVPVLIEAIKEQDAKIAKLEALIINILGENK